MSNGDPNGYMPDPEVMGMAEEIAELDKVINEMPETFEEMAGEVDFIDFGDTEEG